MKSSVFILAGAIAGAAILPSVPRFDTSPAITATIAGQAAAAAARVAAYQDAGAPYGPVTCPHGRCVDAYVTIPGAGILQLEYLHCVDAVRAGAARVWEDGSAEC